MAGLTRIRCALCGAKYWRDAGRDDQGELVTDYLADDGQSVPSDKEGRQMCACGHEIGRPAPRQEFYVGWDGVEYPEVM